jgi:uncharacterized membrane protein YphA (DoxX/SURF4 family)
MSNNDSPKHKTRSKISLVASIIVGLILAFAGSGKIFGIGEMPGQTMMFLSQVIPGFLYIHVYTFVEDIFLPHFVPAIELALGIFLLLGIWPRFMAIFTLLLSMVFMANNSWLISIGMQQFPSCECFGIWEKMFGTLTPLQSLYIDIGLFLLSLTIILVRPGGFFSSPGWATMLNQRIKK